MKIKNIMAIAAAVAVLTALFGFLPANAAADCADFTYELTSAGLTITGYAGHASEVVIAPSYTIDGTDYPVTKIDDYAFEATADLTSVVIPASVTVIGEGAFYDCTSLLNVTVLGENVAFGEVSVGYYYISRREDGIVDGFVLTGPAGSSAQAYAEENGISFAVYVEKIAGDLTGDGMSDIRDMVRLKKVLAGQASAVLTDADINRDGKLSAEDLIALKLLLLYGDSLPCYTVTFADDEGAVLSTQTVTCGQAATAPEAPEKAGKRFVKWDREFGNILGDTVITAEYVNDTEPGFFVENVTVAPGDQSVTVAVSVKNNPGILGMTLTVSFDDRALTLKEAANGPALNQALTMTGSNVLESGCRFVWDGQELSDDLIIDGDILYLTFDVSDSAQVGKYEIELSYEDGDIIDGAFQPLVFTVTNGGVTIK